MVHDPDDKAMEYYTDETLDDFIVRINNLEHGEIIVVTVELDDE